MNEENRGPWYLLTGLVIGVLIGLGYAWLFQPAPQINTSPAGLDAVYKEKQRALIASAYMATGNLQRAQARLELLEDKDLYGSLARQAQKALADGSSPDEARALGMLSIALGQANQPSPTPQPSTPDSSASGTSQAATAQVVSTMTAAAVAGRTPTSTAARLAATASPTKESTTATVQATQGEQNSRPGVPKIQPGTQSVLPAADQTTETATPEPSPTPLPTSSATPAPGGPFSLKETNRLCEPARAHPMLQVMAVDQAGEPQPGVQVIVTWKGGEQHFYTGLKPEVSPGFADFQMTPGTVYSLRLGGGGEPVYDLEALDCEGKWGTWELVFERP